MIEVGFGEINLSKWSMDYARMPTCSLRVLGDTLTAIPKLTRLCHERIAQDRRLAKRIAERAKAVAAKHDALFEPWNAAAKQDWDGVPITLPRLASEMWSVIKDEDWVLTACKLQEWAYKLWDSTSRTAILARRSAPAPRSASRSAWPWRIAARAASSSTSSPTAI